MLSYALVDGFTRVDRQRALAGLKSVIAAADGVILDFAFFSRGALSEAIRLTVELGRGALPRFRQGLEAEGVELFERSAAELRGPPSLGADAKPDTKPVVVMLHLALVAGEG